MLNNKKLFILGMMLGTAFGNCLGNTKKSPNKNILALATALDNDDRPLAPFILPPCSEAKDRDRPLTPFLLPPCSKEDGRGTPSFDGRDTPVKELPPCS